MRKSKLILLQLIIPVLLFSQIPATSNPDSIEISGPELKKDALPNPKSEDGIRELRERTQKRLISIDSNLKFEMDNLMTNFFNSIANSDINSFSSIYHQNTNKQTNSFERENQIYTKLTSEFAKRNIDLSKFHFGISDIEYPSGTEKIERTEEIEKLTVLMMNQKGIMTARFIVQKINYQWRIVEIIP